MQVGKVTFSVAGLEYFEPSRAVCSIKMTDAPPCEAQTADIMPAAPPPVTMHVTGDARFNFVIKVLVSLLCFQFYILTDRRYRRNI